MGVVCVSCQRKNAGLDFQGQKDSTNSTFIDSDSKFHQFIEEKRLKFREKSAQREIKLNKMSKIDEVFNSASNYWQNRHSMELSSDHRPIMLYRIKEISNLIRVNHSIVTRKEYLAAKKIERWYHRIRRRKFEFGRKKYPGLERYSEKILLD